ncbi:MAG: diacylglycerol kinase family lipid kinase [Candidatus Aminicenantes bacterium]|nr:diacylglycerol kinase family lipid kinase [Candidatus Aminicenantes bacterium]
MEKVQVIVNPYSARGKTEYRWESIKSVIKHYFTEFKYIFTEKPNQATEIAREVLSEGFNLIIGIGGDGTLNEIANGFFAGNTKKVINDEASLGMIPSGTGSDFIRFLRIPRDFKKSVELIKNSKQKKIDVGKITYQRSGPEIPHRYFINIADFGLGADVIKKLSTVPESKRSPFSYYSGLLSTIKNYKSKNVNITINDEKKISGKYLIGAIANGGIFGGGMIIAPDAQIDDGYFDLVLVKEMKKFEIIRNTHHLYRGTIINHPKVEVHRVKKLEVSSEDDINIEFDGELGGKIPVRFEIIEKVLNFRI